MKEPSDPTSSQLSDPLEIYAATVTALEEADSHPPAEQILDALIARDKVQAGLAGKTVKSTGDLMTVIQLDGRLRKLSGTIAQGIDLADWRATLKPSPDAWWWFFEKPRHTRDRFDWLWSALTVVFLMVALSLIVDISPRFLSGGPDIWGAFTVISQSVLAMLTAGGILTKVGQESIERVLKNLTIPKHTWPEIKVGLALLLLLCLIGLRLSLPRIAVFYNNRGVANYSAGQLLSAQFDYERAIKLNPDYAEAHYNLGSLYEDLQDFDGARTEYRLAVTGGLDAAYNNLARLYLLDGDYSKAFLLLNKGLGLAQDDTAKYDLLKNLGWVRLEQERYAEAKAFLQAAIGLASDEAAAHCLLAQVLEGQGDTTNALVEWENCRQYASMGNPDEDTWLGMAHQRLALEEEK